MKALLLVDIQNDFLPTGSLPVPEGDAVIPVANRLIADLGADLIVATQDYHPADHGSFASQHAGKEPFQVIDLNGLEQVLWPDHCVQGTKGADFAPGLDVGRVEEVFPKGTDPAVDSYSGFFDNGRRKATGLGAYLKERGIDTVVVLGLATDVCVKHTALDARSLGLTTVLVADGCRGVDLTPGDVDRALDEMKAAGVVITTSSELLAS